MEKMIEGLLNKGFVYDSFREDNDAEFEAIKEATIGGFNRLSGGRLSGKAAAVDADDGVRDITPGSNGRGQAEADDSGVYVGVPAGPDKTAWVNTVKADDLGLGRRARVYQAAYNAAPASEKKAMSNWTPEDPDMSMNINTGNVKDNLTGKDMPLQIKAAPKSSILGSIKNAVGLTEGSVLSQEAFNESVSNWKKKKMKNELFEVILNEASGNKYASSLAKIVSSYNGNNGDDIVARFNNILSVQGLGSDGLVDDFGPHFDNKTDVRAKLFAAIAERSSSPANTLKFYQRYGNALKLDLNQIQAALNYAQQNQTASLQQAGRVVQN